MRPGMFMTGAIILIVLLYCGLCVFLYVKQAEFIYPGAYMPLPFDPGTEIAGLDKIQIAMSDGERLFALRRKPLAGKPVVIFFHGNASYPESYDFLYPAWIGEGYGLLAPAMRGYPRSGGTPDGPKILSDAVEIYDWARRAYPENPIYIIGQ